MTALATQINRFKCRSTTWQSSLGDKLRADRHFFTTVSEFSAHAKDCKSLRLAYFDRGLRQQHQILMDDGQACGGLWTLGADNRKASSLNGAGSAPSRAAFEPDPFTCDVIALDRKQQLPRANAFRRYELGTSHVSA
jgi:deoxyribodipyrimidine photolyase-related protein